MAYLGKPVLAATALAWAHEKAHWGIAAICFFFALLAQIASNFGNDYFDYRKGSDKADRIGPRRAVTSGDISPRAMLAATIATLGVACILGCILIPVGGWWLILAGRDDCRRRISLLGRPLSALLPRFGRFDRMDFLRAGRRKLILLCTSTHIRLRCILMQCGNGTVIGQYSYREQLPGYRRRPRSRKTYDRRTFRTEIRPHRIFDQWYRRPFTGHEVLDCSRNRRLYTSSCLSDSTYQKLSGHGKMVRPGIKPGIGSNRP